MNINLENDCYKKYFEDLLNYCITIEDNGIIYYITNKNIQRQLKYNKLLMPKKEINVDFDKILYESIKLELHYNKKLYYMNSNIYSYFKFKYNLNYDEIETIIIKTLNNILKLNFNDVKFWVL